MRCLKWLALLAPLLLGSADLHAATRLCVQVHTDESGDGLQRLVENELAHHPSHVAVKERCDSNLLVELFAVGGVRYLTARINREVPVRYSFRGARDLGDKLSEALRL